MTMDYRPWARIFLRYIVGGVLAVLGFTDAGDALAGDNDAVLIVTTLITVLVGMFTEQWYIRSPDHEESVKRTAKPKPKPKAPKDPKREPGPLGKIARFGLRVLLRRGV